MIHEVTDIDITVLLHEKHIMSIRERVPSERQHMIAKGNREKRQDSEHPNSCYIVDIFHDLSDEVSVFIFSSPSTTDAVISSCTGTVSTIARHIECDMRISVSDKVIAPISFMAHSPASTIVIHDLGEIVVFYLAILVDDAPGSSSRDFGTSFIALAEDA